MAWRQKKRGTKVSRRKIRSFFFLLETKRFKKPFIYRGHRSRLEYKFGQLCNIRLRGTLYTRVRWFISAVPGCEKLNDISVQIKFSMVKIIFTDLEIFEYLNNLL